MRRTKPGTTRGQIKGKTCDQRIFEALCAHPYGITMPELIGEVYADREDGGPETANSCIQVRVVKMNRKWRASGTGLRIRGSGGPGSRYQIWIHNPNV